MIIVFGSIYMNLDMTVNRFPENSGTSVSSTYTMLPGGRAANQSLAAVRAGASKTALVGRVGDDGPGLRILQNLKRNGVMTSGVAKCVDLPTGVATSVKDKAGERRTFLALGANSLIAADQAPSDIFRKDNILLTQLEIPLEQNALVMKAAHDKGAKVILNVSPLMPIPLPVLFLADYIIIHYDRVQRFAKSLKIEGKNILELMENLAKKAKVTCIAYRDDGRVTLISDNGKGLQLTPTNPVEVLDPSGAEDCFCGTFAACLHEGKSQIAALRMAATAYSIVCTQVHNEEVYPYIDNITKEMDGFCAIEPI